MPFGRVSLTASFGNSIELAHFLFLLFHAKTQRKTHAKAQRKTYRNTPINPCLLVIARNEAICFLHLNRLQSKEQIASSYLLAMTLCCLSFPRCNDVRLFVAPPCNAVQECDATMLHSSTSDRLKKN